MFIFCRSVYAGSIPKVISLDNNKLYVNRVYISPKQLNINVLKKYYSNLEFEKIDTLLLDEFSPDACTKIEKCNFNYFDSILLIHKNNHEINSEAFGYTMYRFIMSNLDKNIVYLGLKDKFILDSLLGEISIAHDSEKEIQSHIRIFKELLLKKNITNDQKNGITYLVNQLVHNGDLSFTIQSGDGFSYVRGKPDSQAVVITKLNNSTRVVKLKAVGNWYFVQIEDSVNGMKVMRATITCTSDSR